MHQCADHVIRAEFKGALFAAAEIRQLRTLTKSSEADECITAQRPGAQPGLLTLKRPKTTQDDLRRGSFPTGASWGGLGVSRAALRSHESSR